MANKPPKPRPNAILKLIADALARKEQAKKTKAKKKPRPWGLPPGGGR